MADAPEPLDNLIHSNVESNPELASKLIDAKLQEKGFVGKIFGTFEHAPTNIIAASVIGLFILIFIALVLSVFFGNNGDLTKIILTLISALTFALGLIFGRRAE